MLLAGGGRLKANFLDYLGDNMSNTQCRDFDWSGELHKTVVHSLTTTFGLDFLLLEDKAEGMLIRYTMFVTVFGQRKKQSELIKAEGSMILMLIIAMKTILRRGGKIKQHRKMVSCMMHIEIKPWGNVKTVI